MRIGTTTTLALALILLAHGRDTAITAAQPATAPATRGAAATLDGIYVALRRVPPTDGSFISNVRLTYVTFFPDGRVLWRLPGEGRDGTYRRGEGDAATTFARDGTFRDDGFMADFGDIQKNDGTLARDDGRGGRGTYAIRSNTLHLKYEDGRAKKVAFTAPPGATPDPSPPQVRVVMESLQRRK